MERQLISTGVFSLIFFEMQLNVDELHLVTSCCLLPYTTQIGEVEISVSLQMYLRTPGLSQEFLEAILNWHELLKLTENDP